jgi:hypothetical protein
MKVRQSSLSPVSTLEAPKPRTKFSPGRVLRAIGLATGLLLVGPAVPALPPAVLSGPAEAATVYQAPLWAAIEGLVVAEENNAGYDRDKYFGTWADTDGDCQNTRQEVLAIETMAVPSYTQDGCEVSGGQWFTFWDNRTHASPSTLQIDHTVPVHEAWGSGARYWSQERRVAYLNDLGDPRTLNAQTSELNVEKNGKSPQYWMPPANGCAYIEQWVAVKIRWGLSVNSGEKATLLRYASSCPAVLVTVIRV